MALTRTADISVIELIVKYRTKEVLGSFRRYAREIEGKFEADKNKVMQAYEAALARLSQKELSEIEDYYADDYQHIDEFQIGLYRKSTLVALYSFLEHSLNELCGHLFRTNAFAIPVTDLRGEGIVRARDYLKKFISVDFSLLNDEWKHLKEFNKIRNCIVHSDGDISQAMSSESLSDIIKFREDLDRQEDKILISSAYIDFIINMIERFLDKLYSQVL